MGRVAALVVLCVAIVSVPLVAEDHESEESSAVLQPEIERYRAFARMYGHVRFFHPSDEAASVDWDRFAVLGVIRIREAGASGDLLEAMNRLFMPIAPMVHIYATGSEPEAVAPHDATAELRPVTWQHVGVRLPGPPSIYLSKRTHREARCSRTACGGPRRRPDQGVSPQIRTLRVHLPLVVDWVEDRVVVTASAVDELQPGDVVSSVDGVDARESLRGWVARMSGSPQRKRVWPLRLFGAGEQGETVRLAVARDEATFEVDVTRGAWKGRPSESRPEVVAELAQGIREGKDELLDRAVRVVSTDDAGS